MSHHTIEWMDRGRPPREPANPAYPDGCHINLLNGNEKSCTVELPYPTGHVNIGTWLVTCTVCRLTVGVTAASRPDDPRSVTVPCKEPVQ
jgi:hypothetical protein